MQNTEMQARDADFVARALLNIEREHQRGVEPGLRRIAVLTIFGGAGAYYISFGHAYNAVLRWMALAPDLRPDPAVASARQLRVIHLGGRVQSMIGDNPGLSVTEALTRVFLDGGAPRFYLSIPQGMRILRRYQIRERYIRSKYVKKEDI